MPLTERFDFREIDGTELLAASYALRYQVYCNERHFEDPADYPQHAESDRYDEHAIHIGGTDEHGHMVATVRLILPSPAGLPLLEHCEIFPEFRHLLSNPRLAEISRLSISKDSRRETRGQGTEIIFGLYRLIYQASKRHGITHWFAAMDKSLARLLNRCFLKFTPIGPEQDYHGTRVPHFASIAEIERTLFERSPALFDQLIVQGLEPDLVPSISAVSASAGSP